MLRHPAIGLYLLGCVLRVESLQHAGGEAWPLTLLASGDSLPLVLKISTSDRSAYRTLQSDMMVRITSRDVSVLGFDAGLTQCQDIMTETVNLPAPHTCATSFDGSALYLTFFADYALQPATTYLFATRLRLLAPGTMRQRTLLCEILEDFEVIDRFGIVIGTVVAMPLQPSLQLSEFRISAAALSREEEFVLEVRLAAASAATSVDPGAQGSVLIWARPLMLWDFSAVSPCSVEIGSGASGLVGGGTCTFLRFPESSTASVADSIGLNAIRLVPAGKIGVDPVTFRFRLRAPSAGTLGVRWYAQAQQLGQPTQAAMTSDSGLSVAPVPTALVSYVRNLAASADNTVQIVFNAGITFAGAGLLRVDVPSSFQVVVAEVQVSGYGRLSSSPSIVLDPHSVTIELGNTDALWTGVSYSLLLRVQNPDMATLPRACADVLSALVIDSDLLGILATSDFTPAAPETWSIYLEVGRPVQAAGTAAIGAMNILLPLQGAFLSPSNLAVDQLNTLQVFFKTSLSLLSTDASIALQGPEEFAFLCLSFSAPAASQTVFPQLLDPGCLSADGLLSLSLSPGQFFAAGTAFSFQIEVINPSLSQAAAIESRLGALEARYWAFDLWSLSLQSRGVSCQTAPLRSPYGGGSWHLFARQLQVQSFQFSGFGPGAEAFVSLAYRLTGRIWGGSEMYIMGPPGYLFVSNIDVDAESNSVERTLPIGVPVINSARPHEVTLPITDNALEGVLYGFRAKIQNALVSPSSQEEPTANRWTVQVIVASGLTSLAGRAEAGSFEGAPLEVLRACDVAASSPVFLAQNQVTVSFLVASSIYTSDTSVGNIHVIAPLGFSFPTVCQVEDAIPSLEAVPSRVITSLSYTSCEGFVNTAVIRLARATAVPRGSQVRFRIELVNPAQPPSETRWNVATFQGFAKLEECENTVPTFQLLQPLNQALVARSATGQDLRPGSLSVYEFFFAYPERTADEAANVGSGLVTRSEVRITLPHGFRAPPDCLSGVSSSASSLGATGSTAAKLPDFVACIGSGRVFTATLKSLISPLVTYRMSITVQNPPADFEYSSQNSRWQLQVESAAVGGLEGPALRTLTEVQILPGNVHESSTGFCMIHFRTASQVPASGSVYVEVPAEFDADCSGGLYDAQTNELGGNAVAQGTPCVVQRAELPGQPHGFILGPLTSPLSSNAAYLLALGLHTGGPNSDTLATWTVKTRLPDGESIDTSRPIPTFQVRRLLGSMAFTPPPLTSPAGEAYPVDVDFTLAVAVRAGALVLYPPPYVSALCESPQALATHMLPQGTSCQTEGAPTGWRSFRLVLWSLSSPWSASRPYHLRVLADAQELPFFRRSWTVQLFAGTQTQASQETQASSFGALASLPGFVVGSLSVAQWRWRGWLAELAVTCQNPAQGARSQVSVEFVAPEIAPGDEVWIRAPPGILLHPFSCYVQGAGVSSGAPIPAPCEVPEPSTEPCFPHVYETQPCADAAEGLLPEDRGFAHRQGMKLSLGGIAAGTPLRILLEATPLIAAQAGKWLVSTWRDVFEMAVATADGYSVWHWMEVSSFRPSTLQPDEPATLSIEWWMLSPLQAGGRLRLRPPGTELGSFDLSGALERFSWGNLPHAGDAQALQAVQASTRSLEVALCCELLSRRSYYFEFGVRHPTADRMPDPAELELNVWIFETLTAEGSVKHYGQIRGYRIFRSFARASVELESELLVGGVGQGLQERTVSVSFSLPFAVALHSRSRLRLLAPRGWQFPDNCDLSVQLGPFTTVASCTASQNMLSLLISGSINPGIEGRSFGIQVAVKPPVSVAIHDFWFLEAYGAVGTPDTLVDPNRYESLDFNLEPRLALPVLGTARRQGATGGTAMAQVLLSAQPPESRRTWRLPTSMVAALSFSLPTVPSRLVNASLRVSVEIDWVVLRCSLPPRPFLTGSLPPGAQCFDSSSSSRQMRQTEVVITIDDLIPLRAGIYNFSLVVVTQSAVPRIEAFAWPRASSWALSLGSGSLDFRTTIAAAAAFEGRNLPAMPLPDLAVTTTTAQTNVLTTVYLLVAVPVKITLPMSFEIQPPQGFRFDTAPSPLHPALLDSSLSNPFRSERTWEPGRQRDVQDPARVPCPFFELMIEDPPYRDISTDSGRRSLCSSLEGDLSASVFAACAADRYVSLPRTQVACFVVQGKVVMDVEALASHCQSCGERAVLEAGQYQLALRGFNPPVVPMVHEEELPKHSWRVTLLRRGANRVPNLNETFSPVAFGSVPNFPLDESSSTTGLWRGRTFPQEADGVASTVVSADDRLSPSRYISLT
ncbi:unnamed protein product [Symbiodinium sp. CCMP2592]|nr:unnamed protein product [Symbiodinium sp. CCMP2592]